MIQDPGSCPWCGYAYNGHDAIGETANPGAGDASLCLACGQLAIFVVVNGSLRTRRPTPEEFDEYSRDPEVTKTMLAIRQTREWSERHHPGSWPRGPRDTRF